jgi:CHASE2 domain-containing sensor protein
VPGKPKVFISYRRADDAGIAGRLADWLRRKFDVFLDVGKIEAGEVFPEVLAREVEATYVLLAVIGRTWATIRNEKGRRLDQTDDFVRREIARALELRKLVIPVLVGGASWPPDQDLPAELQGLLHLQALRINDEDFEAGIDQLIKAISGDPESRRRWLERMLLVLRRSIVVLPALTAVGLMALWMGVLDYFTLDTRAASYLLWAADAFPRGEQPSQILIAAIDDDAEKRFGSFCPTAEWRSHHAQLIRRASAAGARAVVFDLTFKYDSEAEADKDLAIAAASAGNTRVIFATRRVASDGKPELPSKLKETKYWGIECIREDLGYTFGAALALLHQKPNTCTCACTSSNTVLADTPALALTAVFDGRVQEVDQLERQVTLAGPSPGNPLQHVAYSKVVGIPKTKNSCQQEGSEADNDFAMLLIRLSPVGYWNDPSRRISYAAFFDSSGELDAQLRDRIVLVGTSPKERKCGGLPVKGDVHEVIRGFSSTTVPGVELHADAIKNLLNGVTTTPTVGRQAFIMLLLASAGAALSFFTATKSRRRRWILLAAVLVLYGGCAVLLARGNFLLNPLYDLATFFAVYIVLRRLQVKSLGGSAP